VAGDHPALAVGEDRVGEPELADAGRDLRHLGVGVRPGVAGVGDQRRDRRVFVGRESRELTHSGGPPGFVGRKVPAGPAGHQWSARVRA